MDNNERENSNSYTEQVRDNYYEEKNREAQKKDNTANDLGIASLVLGIIALILSLSCCCTYVSIIFSIIGIILGVLAKDSNNKINKLAMIGIVCSTIAIVFFMIIIILSIFGVVLDQNKYFDTL